MILKSGSYRELHEANELHWAATSLEKEMNSLQLYLIMVNKIVMITWLTLYPDDNTPSIVTTKVSNGLIWKSGSLEIGNE